MLTHNAQKGFTLIELMVVVAIGAILAVLAIPSFSAFINNTRLSSTQSQLMSDLNFARSEAVKRNVRTLVCARNAAGTACANSTDWSVGWLVCTDADADGACDASTATNPNPTRVKPPLHSALGLASTVAVITFIANGSAGATTFTLSGTWSGAVNRAVNIQATGNITK
jgi:type IV fimbrial biogenesis protein FimT